METTLLLVLIILVVVLLAIAAAILLGQLRRTAQDAENRDKLVRLEPVAQTVSAIQRDLTELQAYSKARREMETQTAESIRRLETIIAGTQTKGVAGENMLEMMFSKLPAEWQVRNFRVGDHTVEFGLVLPNGLVLPIDSKWPATNLLEEFTSCDDPAAQQRLRQRIESAVLRKAGEVRKYIDPNLTVTFGVAVVPDAVYDLSSGVQPDVFKMNVVLVSYSMFVPYLLLVFQTILKTSRSIDVQRMEAHLSRALESAQAAQGELEGRYARALTMLENARTDLSAHLGNISSGLTNLQLTAASAQPELAEPGPNSSDAPVSGATT
jgi:DNA recombination protein RmuC